LLPRILIALMVPGVVVAIAASDAHEVGAPAAPAAAAPLPEVVASVTERAGVAGSRAPSAGESVAARAALNAVKEPDGEPKNWVLIAAGVYLIGTVLRRRAKAMTI